MLAETIAPNQARPWSAFREVRGSDERYGSLKDNEATVIRRKPVTMHRGCALSAMAAFEREGPVLLLPLEMLPAFVKRFLLLTNMRTVIKIEATKQ